MPYTYHLLDDILTDAEKLAIKQFYDNELMRESVKKVLLAGIYYNGTLRRGEPANPLVNFAIGLAFAQPQLTNEEIGADLRASIAGINALELAFSNLAVYKTEKTEQNKVENPAV